MSPKKTKKSVKAARDARKKTASKKKKGFLGRLFKYGLVFSVWAGLFLGFYIAWVAAELPQITANVKFERKRSVTFLAADGSTLAQIGELKGETVDVKDLPPHLIHALLATEDRRFYGHYGVDPLGIARAMVVNVIKGRFVQGGSTLTQQLAKNLFLTRERTIKRKIQEAVLALWLESQLTKDEILTAYLNRVYFGSGAYGIEAASKLYFKKSSQDLSIDEAALLVGLLKAPSRYSPLANPELSEKRKKVVFIAMENAGYRYQSEGEAYTQNLLEITDRRQVRYFTDWLLDSVQKKVGAVEEDLIVQTTLLPNLQNKAESALINVIKSQGETSNISQGAIVVLENNGAIRVMIGGRSYAESQFNRATQALRPPGSSFKPLVFLTALNRGKKRNDTILDEPITTGRYRPKNFADKYFGEVSLEDALTYSMNTATVRLANEVGIGYVIGTARKMGITSDLERNMSLALGSSGVSLFEMVSAYTVFPNGGKHPKPYAILEIKDAEENVYYAHVETPPPQLFSQKAVQDVTAMLQNVVENGTGRGAKLGIPAGGKTGTSQDYRDAWFIGFTSNYTAGVWLGNDDNAPMDNITGGAFPARIWRSVMQGVAQNDSGNLSYIPEDKTTEENSGFSNFISRIISGSSSQKSPSSLQTPHYND